MPTLCIDESTHPWDKNPQLWLKCLKLAITCKTGPGEYKKHYLGVSDNVTYFVEQLGSKNVSSAHYRVIFKPSVIVPDIEVK